MAQSLPTQAITVDDGSFSGTYWSPANGYGNSSPSTAVGITIPKGWGVVAVTVDLDAGSNYFGGVAANITARFNGSGGTLIGSGSVPGTQPNGSGGITYVGLRSTGINWSLDTATNYPLRDVTALWYQVSPGGDASGIGPSTFGAGTSVRFHVNIAPIHRASGMII